MNKKPMRLSPSDMGMAIAVVTSVVAAWAIGGLAFLYAAPVHL